MRALGLQDNSSLIHSIHNVIMNEMLNDVHKILYEYSIIMIFLY